MTTRKRQALVFQKPVLLRRSVAANMDFVLQPQGGDYREKRDASCAKPGCTGSGSNRRASCRAANSKNSRWRARSPPIPRAAARRTLRQHRFGVDAANRKPARTYARARGQDHPGHARYRPGAPPRRRRRLHARWSPARIPAGGGVFRKARQAPRPRLISTAESSFEISLIGGHDEVTSSSFPRWRCWFRFLRMAAYPRANRSSCSRPPRPRTRGLYDHLLPNVRTRRPGSGSTWLRSAPARRSRTRATAMATCCWCTPKRRSSNSSPTVTVSMRHDLMYNDFVFVGPPDDKAGITGGGSATEALTAFQPAKPVLPRAATIRARTKRKSRCGKKPASTRPRRAAAGTSKPVPAWARR